MFIFDAFQNRYLIFFANPKRYIGLLHSTTLIPAQLKGGEMEIYITVVMVH